jgi:hypothetical protein
LIVGQDHIRPGLFLRRAGGFCALGLTLATGCYQDAENVAGGWPQSWVVAVPLSQRVNNLLPRPILQIITPPRKLRGFDVLCLMRLEICA